MIFDFFTNTNLCNVFIYLFIKPLFTVKFLLKRLQNYDNLHEWAQSTCAFREPKNLKLTT